MNAHTTLARPFAERGFTKQTNLPLRAALFGTAGKKDDGGVCG